MTTRTSAGLVLDQLLKSRWSTFLLPSQRLPRGTETGLGPVEDKGMITEVTPATATVSSVITAIAEHFKTKCKTENGYDKLYKFIKGLAEELGTLTIADVIAYLRGGSSGTIVNLYLVALGKAYRDDSVEYKFLKAYFNNLLVLGAYQLYLLSVSSPKGQADQLRDTATSTCTAFTTDAAKCETLVKLIGCLETSLTPQAEFSAQVTAGGFKAEVKVDTAKAKDSVVDSLLTPVTDLVESLLSFLGGLLAPLLKIV